MGLPKITINLTNGAFASAATDDGVAGLLCVGVGVAGLALNTPTKFTSLKQAEDAGITAAADTTNSTDTWQQVSEFFAAGGTTLWLMTQVNTVTLTQSLDVANNYAKKLLEWPAAEGKIRVLGVSRYTNTAMAYTPTIQAGLDIDTFNALPKAQALAEAMFVAYKPVRIVIDGHDFQGNATTLTDLRTLAYNRVAVALCNSVASRKNASIGLVLGKLSAVPVQRKIGRVKSEKLPITDAYFTNGAAFSTLTSAQVDTLYDKGYLIVRQYAGRTGYWFANDPTATSLSDDYNSLSRGRVIDKAVFYAYNTYVEELLDEVPVTSEGKVAPVTLSYYKTRIETVLIEQMQAKGEISGVTVDIDPNQLILLTNKLEISLRILPLGYLQEIVVNIGFLKP